MQTATDRPKTDCTHWKVIKNNKIEKKKKLQEENDKIDRILRSPEYTEADKQRHFKERERNLKEIIKLSDEINKIDNGLLYPGGSCPVESRLYAESSRYGEEIFQLNSKMQDMDSEVSYRLRIQNADFSIQHRNLSIENKHLRDVNYKLRLDSEIFFKQLEAEKKTLATMLQDQNTEITRYKLAVVELEHDNALIQDEKERFTIERKSLNGQIKELSCRLRRSENDYKNKTDALKHELADLRRDFALLQEEKDELIERRKAEMKEAKDVQKELDDARREEVKFRDRIKELERQMMTVPNVDLSMSAENIRLKKDLKHLEIELKNSQQRLRGLESVYKNETDTLKHELADLKKKIELLQEEKEELVESEETERKIAETVQNELDDAKRETLMLQDRIKELQRQMKSFPKVDPSMAEENSRLKEDHKHLGIELQKAQQKITENEGSVRHYMRQVETLQREKQQAIAEKESALTRLSALAGDRLRDNNAAIADLSDENRPINLGEKFSELYDNQWTDAIEKLEKLMTERDAIQKLLSMIQKIYCVCKDIAKEQLDLIAEAFGLEGRREKLKRLKDFRKSMAPDNLQDIKKRVDSSCVSKDFSEEAAYCASYINRSVELCWYMCIQDPPVLLEFKASHGDVFNDKIYRHFTKSGRTIDYMVWPVMYLHSNGPLLQKGVVQPV